MAGQAQIAITLKDLATAQIKAMGQDAQAAFGQASDAAAALNARIETLHAQMREVSDQMMRSPAAPTGAFAGQSYDQLTEQFGQLQQQWMAARDQLAGLDEAEQQFGASASQATESAQAQMLQLQNGMKAYAEVSRQALNSQPVIVYDKSIKSATASAKDWEKQADAALAGLRAETAARGQASVAAQRQAASTRKNAQAEMSAAERVALLRRQYDALALSERNLSKLSILSPAQAEGLRVDRELMAQVKAEAMNLGATMQESGKRGAGGLYEMVTGVREFRAVFAATIGIVSFGFWITEWQRIADWTGKALQNMEGIHTAQNDIVMSSAFQALKQVTGDLKKQLMEPHSAAIAQMYEQAIQIRVATLERLREEVQGLKDGTLAGEQYAKALQDIAAHSRELGLEGAVSGKALFGSQTGVLEQIEKQIQAYRALLTVEQQYEEKQQKTSNAAKKGADSAKGLQRAIDAAQRAVEHATPTLPPLIHYLVQLSQAEDAAVAKAQALRTVFQQSEQYGQKLPGGLLSGLTPGAMPQPPSGAFGPMVTPEMQAATKALDAQTKAQQAAMRAQQLAYQRTAQIARESFMIMGEAVGQYGGTFGRVFSQVSRLISLMVNLHRLESVSAVQAANAKAAGQAAAIGKVSFIKSMFETAEGIAALARLDFSAAAQHFAASAKFLTVITAVASVAGSFASLGSSGGGSAAVAAAAGGSASGSTAAAPTPGPLTPKDNQNQNQNQVTQVVFHFHGSIYGGPSATDEIVNNINSALTGRRLKLYATHTITGKSLG